MFSQFIWAATDIYGKYIKMQDLEKIEPRHMVKYDNCCMFYETSLPVSWPL